MADTLLIWGAGAIGGVLGAYWARNGHDVLFVDIAADHVDAMNSKGLIIEGPVEAFEQTVKAVTPDKVSGTFKRIVLAVKAHHTETAARQLAPHLAPDGYVLSAQNGLNEIALAEILGPERVIGCFVNFGADYLEPGRIMRGNRAAVVVGEIDGSIRPRTKAMHALLQEFEPDAVLTDDIWAYLWGKLGYGALLFGTALTNDSIADALDSKPHLPVWKALGGEVMQVAAKKKANPLGFNGFSPEAFAPGGSAPALQASIDAMVSFNRGSAKSHSGVWRDLAVRKRKTEVDQQMGIIAEIGRSVGVATPVLERMIALIHEIEDGKRPLALANLDDLLPLCPKD